ncbi:MAG: nuclear transport factor 2 family protein [Betaproteobacteria bacterium]
MRKTFTATLFIASLLATAESAYCCDPITAQEAIKSEDERYAAQMSNDVVALERLIANDLVYIHSSSTMEDKKVFIESLRSGAVKYRNMRRLDVVVRTFGCVATLTGIGNFDVTLNNKEMTVDLRFHSVWVKRDGQVQFVSWQSTRLPAK